MGIFQRIYRIAKSEVNARLRRDPKTSKADVDSDFPDDFEVPRGKAQGSKASQQTSSGHDPKLEEWYGVLELPYGSDFEKVQKAWKDLLRKYHPDKHASDPGQAKIAHQVTQQLNQAYTGLQKHLRKV